ncbi:MAG: hypothetical protein NDI75_05335 [Candidatus Didemnitutus sp.]|nr:hypothetical protein [Candidatus Didemnitutus sp.]
MRLRLSAFLILLCLVPAVRAQPYVPGETYFGTNSYVEYQPGDTPIIITAPHGGTVSPSTISFVTDGGQTYSIRTNGTYNGVTYTDIVTGTDTNTQDLARRMAAEIFDRTGKRAHLIISRLHRSKLDPNRDLPEAALGNTISERAWREYHDFIRAARVAAEAAHGFGFVVDVHGHGHTIQRLELGYNYDAELDQTDTALNHPGYALKGTIHTLSLQRPGLPFPTLLRGAGSLGDLFNRRNFPSWPSPEFPTPGAADFFDGGYTVQEHSCIVDNGQVNGVQIECNMTGVRDTESNRADFATAFARVMHIFLYNHYGYLLGAQSLARFDPPASTTLRRGGPPVTLTATRTGDLSLSSSLALSFGGDAISGTDYTASHTSLSFAANVATASLTITPAAAANTGGDRVLTVAFTPSVTQTADTTPLRFTIEDGLSQTVRAAFLAPQLSEGAGSVTLRLTRTSTSGSPTVPLTWGGTALRESDYYGAPDSVQFPAGVATRDVLISLVDDGRAEPNKTIVVNAVAGSGYLLGAPASAQLELIDDDRPSQLVAWLRGDLANNVAADSSGQQRHATTLPADSAMATGPGNTTVSSQPAFTFDGVDDTIVLPRFAPQSASGEITLAFFFRLEAHPLGAVTNHTLLNYGSPRGAAGTLQIYPASSSTLRANLGGINLDVGSPPSNWQDGAWRHYALSLGANGEARVYVDGVLRRTASVASGLLNGQLLENQLFWLGWRALAGGGSLSTSSFMKGGLRDFRVYRRALAQPEIVALANNVQTYAAWLAQNNLPANLAGANDADTDGFPALVEYGLGARPAVADLPPRYRVEAQNSRLALTFLRDTTATDLTWTIEASTDLGTWQALATRTGAASSWTINAAGTTATEDNGYVVVTDSVTVGAQTGRFLRLRVNAP